MKLPRTTTTWIAATVILLVCSAIALATGLALGRKSEQSKALATGIMLGRKTASAESPGFQVLEGYTHRICTPPVSHATGEQLSQCINDGIKEPPVSMLLGLADVVSRDGMVKIYVYDLGRLPKQFMDCGLQGKTAEECGPER